MDIDDDEDFYAPEPGTVTEAKPAGSDKAATPPTTAAPAPTTESKADDKAELEEGEEEDDDGAMDEDDDEDSDIDIITERKDGTKAAPPTQSRYSDIRNIPQRSTSNDVAVKPAPSASKSPTTKAETPSAPLAVPSADRAAAAASSSKIDVNGIPTYEPAGKRITAVNIDEDLAENDKPWRRPGTDISDYFNYGFDEFTWALYAAKQEQIRGEFNADSMMGGKKMMEDFGMMMMGSMNMPGGAPAGPSQGAMPGMDGMNPDMQQMMQAMMQSGMDPSQMDPSAMSAMFAGMQGQGGQGGQGQNFGGQGGFGGNQGGFGGYDQQGMGGGGGGGRGGFGGRGRGGRRW
ncbi:Fip1 domain-containing protein [Plectosphaerella cucumerina]|uniref:Fip1 domain-containing protein n=1 Tax=Plectosphaerella cucumerina TaxID=40658 RepID=A0A8K0TUZ7_9PEZI|nr:Fip1 domain-containing protein [Plectosphaerella cucumerina]